MDKNQFYGSVHFQSLEKDLPILIANPVDKVDDYNSVVVRIVNHSNDDVTLTYIVCLLGSLLLDNNTLVITITFSVLYRDLQPKKYLITSLHNIAHTYRQPRCIKKQYLSPQVHQLMRTHYLLIILLPNTHVHWLTALAHCPTPSHTGWLHN